MALARWDPTREVATLQGEMNRLFSSFFGTPGGGGNGGSQMRRWIPAMDLAETEDALVLKADLPGMREEDVSIEVARDVLTISGERTAEHEERNEGYYRVERAAGYFSRSLTLPPGVDPEAVQASFGSGVLTVRIPKPEQLKPKRVRIGLNEKEPRTIDAEGTDSAAQAQPAGAAAT
jgi:HSP20 family protein